MGRCLYILLFVGVIIGSRRRKRHPIKNTFLLVSKEWMYNICFTFSQYFGYDPNTYVDPESEADKNDKNNSASTTSNRTPVLSTSISTVDKDLSSHVRTVFEQPPPRLPRPLSKLNCVQSRTTLSRLLRYQQAGNNPVYGSPETRPPW